MFLRQLLQNLKILPLHYDVFHSKNKKVEGLIEVKVGSKKELTSIDLDCFDEISLRDLSPSAPGVVMSVKIIKQ